MTLLLSLNLSYKLYRMGVNNLKLNMFFQIPILHDSVSIIHSGVFISL